MLGVTGSSLGMNLDVIASNAPHSHISPLCLLLFVTFV